MDSGYSTLGNWETEILHELVHDTVLQANKFMILRELVHDTSRINS